MSAGAGKLIDHLRRLTAPAVLRTVSDSVLLARFVNDRDELAFTALMARHGPMVLNLCRRMLGHAQAAEDAFQAVFLVLARKAGSVRRGEALASWLYGVAYRVALKNRRAEKRGQDGQSLENSDKIIDPRPDPLALLTARDLLAVLESEVQRLPKTYRMAVALCCLEGLSQKEAAQRLGWKEGTLKAGLERGRARLHARLARRGLTLSAALGVLEATRGGLRAALSLGLANRTAQAAVAFATSKGASSTTVSAGVLQLAQSALKGTAFFKLKLVLAVTFLMGLTALGAGGWAPSKPEFEADAPEAAPAQPEPPKGRDAKPRVDLYGDPLPAGALARLGTVRFRSDTGNLGLAFSPNGKTLVAQSGEALIAWDPTTGKEIYRLAPPAFRASYGQSFAISLDGSTLAVIEYAGETIGLYALPTGKKLRALTLPSFFDDQPLQPFGNRTVLCFAPDGKGLAASSGEMVFLFDLATDKARISFARDQQPSWALAYSPDGKTLGLVGADLQLRDVATGKIIRSIETGKKGFAQALAFSPDGKIAALGCWDLILLIDPSTGKELGRLEADMEIVESLSFTPGSKTVVSGSQDGKVRVWDVATGTARLTLATPMFASSMALSPDGKTVAVGSYGRALRLWDVTTGKELFTEFQGHRSTVECLAFSPDGRSLVSGAFYDDIRVWDTKDWKPSSILKGGAGTLSFAADGKRMVSVSGSKKIDLWDMEASKKATVITVADTEVVRSAMFSTDGHKIITLDVQRDATGKTGNIDWTSHRLRHWNAATGSQDKEWKIPGDLYKPVVTPNGMSVVVSKKDTIGLYDVTVGRDRMFTSSRVGGLRPLAISADSKLLLTGDYAGEYGLRLWEMATGKVIQIMQGHEYGAQFACWSANGRMLASADGDKTVRLWDVVTGRELASFTGLTTSVSALTFSPDGAYLAAGFYDSTILVWDVRKATRASKFVPKKLLAADLETCWADLAESDTPKAYQAMWKLIAAGPQSVSLLQGMLEPVAGPGAAKIQQWIGELDSDKFALRQAAAKELGKVGEQAAALIQKALKDNISLEMRLRLEQIQSRMPDVPGLATLRTMRAIMVLEQIGSADARVILADLAKGAPGATETLDAQAALARLAGRGAKGNLPRK